MKNIYVVVSHTGSIISRIISKVTGDEYSHVSVSFDDDLESMYSFGRIYTNFPFIGGFVRESTDRGMMKKFRMTANIVVVQLTVEDDKYFEVRDYIMEMYAERKKYHYNYIGLFLAKRGVLFKRNYYFYCSEFVKDVLERFNLVDKNELKKVVRPVELMNLRGGKIIYKGKLCEFAHA